ncbi:MAG: hypothetical protein JJ974_04560 [Phycisphaerales bacterium]|nr:hypothetical protein [Phycisphaerales bacterium]
MFSRKSKQGTGSKSGNAPRAEHVELLREAVDRNTSVGVVHQCRAGYDPLAQGRLLKWDDEGVVIEELQIIGRDIRLRTNDMVEAYLSYDGVMLSFEAKILMVEEPTQLNEHRVVRSLMLSKPMNLRESDRRSAFRASLSGFAEEIPVNMWFFDRYQSREENAPKLGFELTNAYYTDLLSPLDYDPVYPLDVNGAVARDIDWGRIMEDAKVTPPHAVGRLIDLTRNGLGILMYGVSYMQLDRFERIGVSFELEGKELDFVVELRRGTDLKGSTCRVGVLLIYPEKNGAMNPERRVLEQFAMQIQREHLRNRKAS